MQHMCAHTQPAPPVDSDFVGNCGMQMRRSRDLECEEDGTFSAVQCMGPMCFCVDVETGERVNTETFHMHERDSINCSAGERA